VSYGLDGQDSIPGRARDFSLLHSVQVGTGAHLAHIQWIPSLKVKRPGREVDHSHLVLRSRMAELNCHTPLRLHDIAFNEIQGRLCLLPFIYRCPTTRCPWLSVLLEPFSESKTSNEHGFNLQLLVNKTRMSISLHL
jgi:hypothetical protein